MLYYSASVNHDERVFSDPDEPESDLAWQTANLIRGLARFPVSWDTSAASQAR